MLKHKITKAEFDALSDIEKSHYILDAGNSGSYSLHTSGESAVEATVRAQLGSQGVRVAELETALATAKAEAKAATEVAEAKSKKTIEDLTNSVVTMRTAQITEAKTAAVAKMAANFTMPDLFKAAIGERITVTHNEAGELVYEYKDKDGKATTEEALTKEYCTDPAYSAMLVQKNTVTTPNGNGQQNQQFMPPNGNANQQRQIVTYGADGKATGIDHANATPEDYVAAARTLIEAKS